jgi:hypothetical protein
MTISAKGKRFMNMSTLATQFAAKIDPITESAARAATDASRLQFNRLAGHRPIAPPRSGRATTGGAFASLLTWTAAGGNIAFDIGALPPSYVYVQELGTGPGARGNIIDPIGAVVVATIDIPSQKGRKIPRDLVWGSGPGGNASDPHSGVGHEQLYSKSTLDAKSVRALNGRRLIIKREIVGKHFIAQGGTIGYLQLRRELVDEAIRTFR